MSKLIPSNMGALVGNIVSESAPVHLKNEGYGFLGTLHGGEPAKRDHLHKIVPHAKAALTHALAKHQATDAHYQKTFGLKTSAQARRAKMKVTNKTVSHFLDSSHGRHIADGLNAGQKHHENPGSLQSRAHHFMRDYEPKVHESYDDGDTDLSVAILERDEAQSINSARSIHHAILQSKGVHADSPEYIKLMQDFLAGYKNGASVAESYLIAEATEEDGYWTAGESVLIDEAVKGTGDVSSYVHKAVKKSVAAHGEALKGTISNIDHHDDGNSTLHVRHTKPQALAVVKMIKNMRKEHGNNHEFSPAEQLQTKTKPAPCDHPIAIHTQTKPLAGSWYTTHVHFKGKHGLKEGEDLDETSFYGSDDGTLDPDVAVPGVATDSTTPSAMQQEEELDESKKDEGRPAPYGMSWKEYYKHEFGKEKSPKLEKGARVDVGHGKGTVHELYKKKIVTGHTKTFMHVKHDDGKEEHYRVDTTKHKILKEAAPSPDGSAAKKLTTEAPILDADTDALPEPRDGEENELATGIGMSERFDHGSAAKLGIIHSHQAGHMEKGRSHSYFHPKTGRQTDGEVVHKTRSEVHVKNSFDGQLHKFKVQDHLSEDEVFIDNVLDEEFNSHEQASVRKEYLDKKHPRTVHEVVQGRRSGKYFVVRKNQHGSHVAEAVCFPDLESGGATQTMKTYDDPSIDEEKKASMVKKIKSIVKTSKE